MHTDTIITIILILESLFVSPSYKHGAVGYPKTFSPLYAESDSEKMISSLVFKGLFKYDENQNIVPELAEGYNVSEDGLQYDVILKEGLFWHNGDPITSNDILYTASKSKVLREVSTDKIDDRTVRFSLPNKFSPFLDLLTLRLVPEGSGSKKDALMLFGSGDYKIARIKTDKSNVKEVILITKDPKYFFKKLVFKFYDTEEMLMNAYKLGEVNGFLSKNRFIWENVKDYRVNFLGRYFALIFNTEKELLNSPEKRKVLADALDYNYLFNNIVSEKGVKAHGPLGNTWANLEDLEFFNYVVSPAKEIDPDKKLKFFYMQGDLHKDSAKFIKTSWEKLGFSVDVFELPLENLLSEIRKNNDFDILLIGQEVSKDPDRYVFWHSTQATDSGLNFGNYKGLRVDKALEEGRKSLDKEERKKHYGIMQKAFIEDYPAVFLYHPTFHFYISSSIEGISLKEIYYPWDIFRGLENWKLVLGF